MTPPMQPFAVNPAFGCLSARIPPCTDRLVKACALCSGPTPIVAERYLKPPRLCAISAAWLSRVRCFRKPPIRKLQLHGNRLPGMQRSAKAPNAAGRKPAAIFASAHGPTTLKLLSTFFMEPSRLLKTRAGVPFNACFHVTSALFSFRCGKHHKFRREIDGPCLGNLERQRTADLAGMRSFGILKMLRIIAAINSVRATERVLRPG